MVMILSQHAKLREQQRAISPIMSGLLDEYGMDWKTHKERCMQILSDEQINCFEVDAKLLIRECKQMIRALKRVEKKASSRDKNMQVVTQDGVVVTEANSQRIKRKG